MHRHHQAASRRIERYRSFQKFYRDAEPLIQRLSGETDELAYFSAYYSFAVVAGGIDGGFDERAVDVLFGNKPYDSTQGPPQVKGGEIFRSTRLHSEQGASMRYELTDAGEVLCLLYPARSERMRSSESFYLLEVIPDPVQLLDPRIVRRHLRYLACYMAATSLDGAITVRQRIRMTYLKCTKRYAVGRAMKSPRAQVFLAKVATWVLTVACSGAALFMLQRIWPEEDGVTPAVRRAAADAQREATRQRYILEKIHDALSRPASTSTPDLSRAPLASPGVRRTDDKSERR